MSQLIDDYYRRLARIRRVSGGNEMQIREAFKRLLDDLAEQRGLIFVAEDTSVAPAKNKVTPDGTLFDRIGVRRGFYEAKGPKTDLDAEIAAKFRSGYPNWNILFEDGDTVALWQNGQEVLRVATQDRDGFGRVLDLFFDYETPAISQFNRAVDAFQDGLPDVLTFLRELIAKAYEGNDDFAKKAAGFLSLVKKTVNPALSETDVREMLIQHVLTEEIFTRVFRNADFHRDNNVASQLYDLERTFFAGGTKRDALKNLRPYYQAIETAASEIEGHTEKQRFLKVIYEGFYQTYNPEAADNLGVVYTPPEIVRFMVQGADWLCREHFGRALSDEGVDILDPATGTGTFVCELIDYMRHEPEKLAAKYAREIHANEVALLPYYIANLNIEATYAEAMGKYTEYPNLCFVDTLDNIEGLGEKDDGSQRKLLGGVSAENVERVARQNARDISVVIGNPPYNAWQRDYADGNPNRTYARIDERVKLTYVAKGTAQNKNSVYDMYTRFFRWASDRLRGDGVVAFVTGRKPFAKLAYDGFRRVIEEEFADVYVVDLGGDVRDNPKLSGTKHNVFGIQTGVAISFLVKRTDGKPGKMRFVARPEDDTARDKLEWLSANRPDALAWKRIEPDEDHHWFGDGDPDWAAMLPVANTRRKSVGSNSMFSLITNGLQTKKDEWLYDLSKEGLHTKVNHYIAGVNERLNGIENPRPIKLDRETVRRIKSDIPEIRFRPSQIVDATARPYVSKRLYFERNLISVLFNIDDLFGSNGDKTNQVICFHGKSATQRFTTLMATSPFDICYLKTGNGSTFGVPRYRYNDAGERLDNITDWALARFEAAYPGQGITKDDLFAYAYGVLHDPAYRDRFAVDLKRSLPRVPLYPDFRRWAGWGRDLMGLHLSFEDAPPFDLDRIDTPDPKAEGSGVPPKPVLRSDHDEGVIRLDKETQLAGVPADAWRYTLGNRAALDWVLDQHKEKKIRDDTVRERFDTYRFADHKERVIDLLRRVTTVSVGTVAITDAMMAQGDAAREPLSA